MCPFNCFSLSNRTRAAFASACVIVLAACGGGARDVQPVTSPGPSPVTSPGPSPVTSPGPSPVTSPGPSPGPSPVTSPVTSPGPSPVTSPGPSPVMSPVNTPTGVVLTKVAVTGLQAQAQIGFSRGIVRESGGTYAFVSGNAVLRLAADLQSITTIAGSVFDQSGTTKDGLGADAKFNGPYGITVDQDGSLYVTERLGHVIRRVATDGEVKTIAGLAGTSGNAIGTGSVARFYLPEQIALGPDRALYVADLGNHVIRRITTAGDVSTYAGVPGEFGFNEGPAATAKFFSPAGIAVATNGTVYVADANNNRIRRIERSGSGAGNVDTLAGNGKGNAVKNDTGSAAKIGSPGDLALSGNTLYVRDNFGLVRKIDVETQVVTTFAGTEGEQEPTPRDGPPGAATIGTSSRGGSLVATPNGGLLVTEANLFLGAVRSVDASGLVTTLAKKTPFGTPFGGSQFSPGTGVLSRLPFSFVPDDATPDGLSKFSAPIAVASAPDGSLVVGTRNYIRRIATDGSVSPIIGLGGGGNFDGKGSAADAVSADQAIVVAPNGNIYFSDTSNIRVIDSTNTARSFAGAAGTPAAPTSGQGAQDGLAAEARFSLVKGLARDASGNLYASDTQNYAIRRIDADRNVSTYAGVLKDRGTTDGTLAEARFTGPLDVSVAPDGSLWLLDGGRNATPSVRRILPDRSVSTLPTLARRLTVDPAGTIYVISEAGDLASLNPVNGALTVLVQTGDRLTLGSDPRLGPFSGGQGFAAVGTKQLVLLSDAQLIRVTLP